MSEHEQVIRHFIRRLMQAITRSPLLRTSVSRRGHFLDCSRLESVEHGLGERLLRNVVSGVRKTIIDVTRVRSSRETATDAPLWQRGAQPSDRGDRRALESELCDLLDRRMRRYAEAIRRETGVNSLWLAYPLLFVRDVQYEQAQRSILAPVFLWPVCIETNLRQEGHFSVRRTAKEEPPKFDQVMAVWVRRRLGIEMDQPSEEELHSMGWPQVQQCLEGLAKQFATPPTITCGQPLKRVPTRRELEEATSPMLLNCAVLGCFRWQNQAILADLESMRGLAELGGVAGAFTSGRELARPSPQPPPATRDQYPVLEADFSQEKVIWQARLDPGVVVDGPPGTGKSQTIVNIIADTLARAQTVLMVCQKQAATQVVLKRLREVGLDGLCVAVHDTHADRMSAFRDIRGVAEGIRRDQVLMTGTRGRLASEITGLESKLNDYAAALQLHHTSIGLRYPEVLAHENRLYRTFPTLRSLPELREVVGVLSADNLNDFREHIQTAGTLFRTADPLHNPWRHRQVGVQESPGLIAELKDYTAALEHSDCEHMMVLGERSSCLALPEDLDSFESAATSVLPLLEKMVVEPEGTWATLLRKWVAWLEQNPPPRWLQRLEQCQHARDIAEDLSAVVEDREVAEYCRALSEDERSRLVRRTHDFTKW